MRRAVPGSMLIGIRRQKRGDKIVRYHRATGIRLPDGIPETHPEFISAWAMAEAQGKKIEPKKKQRGPVGSLAYAVQRMRLARKWSEISDGHKQLLTRHGDKIAEAYGSQRVAIITKQNIKDDLAKLTPDVGNARLKAWRWLCKQAIEDMAIKEDPSQGIAKAAIKTDGFIMWSQAEVDQFRERWPVGGSTRACFELVCWTAARTNDAVRLSRSMVGSDGILVFKQSKTDWPAHVPWTCDLPEWSEDWHAEREMMHKAIRCLSGGFTFLEVHGRVRSIKGLGNIINNAARDAGLVNRTAHGLRKYRLTAIAEAGGSPHAIMAWGGHKTLDEVGHYTRAAEMKRLISGTKRKQNVVSVRE